MENKIYKLAEIALTTTSWPIALIVISVLFRKQISALFNKIIDAKNFKVQTPVLNFETTSETTTTTITTIKEELTDTVEQTKTLVKSVKHLNDWFYPVFEHLEKNEITEAKDFFNDYVKANGDHIEYHKENPVFLCMQYDFTTDPLILKDILSNIEQTHNLPFKKYYINSYCECLAKTKQYSKIITILEREISITDDIKLKSEYIIKLSSFYLKDLQPPKAEKLILDLLLDFSKKTDLDLDELYNSAYHQLAEVEKNKDNSLNYALCLDKAGEYDPTNKDNIFSAAYQSSKTILRALEVSNYCQLLEIDPKNDMALNNLGVTAGTYNLKNISGKYFHDAQNLNNTLAMANIGGYLLDAGLIKAAEEVVEKALKDKSPHENIHHLITRISSEKEDQLRKWEEIKRRSFETQKEYRNYTQHYYNSSEIFPMHENWLDNNNSIVKSNLTADLLVLTWESETDIITLTAGVYNSTFNGVYSSKSKNSQNSLLGMGNTSKTFHCLGYYDRQSDKIIINSTQVDEEFKIVLTKQ